MTSRSDIAKRERYTRHLDEVVIAEKRLLRDEGVHHLVSRLYGRYTAWQKRYGLVALQFIEWLADRHLFSHTWERDRDGVSEETRKKRASAVLVKFTQSEYTLLNEQGVDQLNWLVEGVEALISTRYALQNWRITVKLVNDEHLNPCDLYFELVENDDDDTEEDRIAAATEDARDEVDGYRPEDDSDDDLDEELED